MRSDTPKTGVAAPRLIEEELSSLCATGLAPGLILSGAILGLCRQHFSSTFNIVDPELRTLIWSAAPELERSGQGTSVTSKICIEMVTRWAPPLVAKRPGIFVKRNGRKPQRLAIGDRYHGRAPGHYQFDMGIRYEVLLLGSYTLFCVARTGAEADALGTEVQLRLLEFAPVIRQDLNLARFEPMEMSEASVLEESTQHFAVAVPVAYAFTHGWRLAASAPVLKTADIRTSE